MVCGLLGGAVGGVGAFKGVSKKFVKKLDFYDELRGILGRGVVLDNEINLIRRSQSIGLLSPDRNYPLRFMKDFVDLKKADFNQSEIKKLINAGGPRLSQSKSFVESLEAAEKAIGRDKGFYIEELDSFVKVDEAFRNGYSEIDSGLQLGQINEALTHLRDVGFSESDVVKLIDNEVFPYLKGFSKDGSVVRSVKSYMDNLNQYQRATGNSNFLTSQGRLALKQTQESLYKQGLDNQNAVLKLTSDRIRDSLAPLRGAGYSNKDIRVMLDNDMLVIEPATKQAVANYLGTLSN